MLLATTTSELFLRAVREAQVYKHEKQRLQHADLGDSPIIEWFKLKWPGWYRDKWIEHLCGRRLWKEFGKEDFDLISDKSFQPNIDLVLRIIDNLKKHRDNISENLGMIFVAAQRGDSELNDVVAILKRLDVNSKRRPSCDELRIRILFAAVEEADRHKFIESKNAGCDLGEKVVQDWFDDHWEEFANQHGISGEMD